VFPFHSDQATAVVTTRHGGVSTGAYGSLNLGGHVGDDPAAVAENRRRLAAALGVDKLAFAAYLEALLVEKSYRDAAAELGTKWPGGCCVEASIDLRDVLEHTWPKCKAVLVWGQFELRPPRFAWDHAWVEVRGGTIIDVTAGQYVPDQPGESAIVVPPDHGLYRCYAEKERDPSWAR
jgi:hypothetical protein